MGQLAKIISEYNEALNEIRNAKDVVDTRKAEAKLWKVFIKYLDKNYEVVDEEDAKALKEAEKDIITD